MYIYEMNPKFLVKIFIMAFFLSVSFEIENFLSFFDIDSKSLETFIKLILNIHVFMSMLGIIQMLINGEVFDLDHNSNEETNKEKEENNEEKLSLSCVERFNYTINKIQSVIQKERVEVNKNNLINIINEKEKELLKINNYVKILNEDILKIKEEYGESNYFICKKNYNRIKALVESEISYFNKLSIEYLNNSQNEIKDKFNNNINELINTLNTEIKDAV